MNTVRPSTFRPLPLSTEASAPALNARVHQKRILFVDDEEALLRLCSIILSGEGYAVTTAADGLEGWQALQTGEYDLLITDIRMPHLSGIDLAGRARLAGMSLPIIILSGSIEQLTSAQISRLALAALLRKPVPVPKLLRAIECATGESPAPDTVSTHMPRSPLALAPIEPWIPAAAQ